MQQALGRRMMDNLDPIKDNYFLKKARKRLRLSDVVVFSKSHI